MRLVQLHIQSGARAVAEVGEGDLLSLLTGHSSVYDLSMAAIDQGTSLVDLVDQSRSTETESYNAALRENRVLLPVDHPDPAHCHVTGTGLTHLGSADTRDQMHKKSQETVELTDSMKMFRMGLDDGKPEAGKQGVQPEWFYKGNGHSLVAPEGELPLPSFASDGGEEPEVAGIYVIGRDGKPYRIGLALGNEYSDHIMERVNYLWLAPSKIRASSFGPELLLGDLPRDIQGTSRILRKGKVHWEKPFASGEANMSHSIANLEYHQFKYPIFRQPGDVHVHYFGTATLSYADKIKPENGDVFEIECADFGRPLRNTLRTGTEEEISVKAL